jgi:hypothetical protein
MRFVRRFSMRTALAPALVALLGLAVAPAAAKGTEQVLRYQQLTLAMGGHEVGTTTARDVKTDMGFRFEREADLRLRRGETLLQIKTRSVSVTNEKLRPVSFRFERNDASGSLVSIGEVKGDKLLVKTAQAGATVENLVPLTADLLFAAALEHKIRSELASLSSRKGPLTISVFVEDMGAVTPTELEVKKLGEGWQVKTRMAGLESIDRLDAHGHTLLSETAALDALAYPVGSAPPKSVKPGDVDMLARSTWPAPRLSPRTERVRFRVHTPDAKTFHVPEDARQRVVARTDTWVDVEVRAGRSSSGALRAAEVKALTAATPYEPVGDARLKAKALEVTKGSSSTEEKIERLVRFVFEHVENKGLDRGYAPALATLESAAGDCTEHSVLLSALLRSLGVPTRLVDGVIVDGGRAGYHEWVEVQIDAQGFIAADPTFGAFPAGPERLKLAEGSSSPEGLLSLGVAAGRLLRPGVKVEVLEASPPPGR